MSRSPHQDAIDALYRKLCEDDKPSTNGNGRVHKTGTVPPPMNDERVIELCRKAKNAAKFASLFDDGDLSEYDRDDSDADAGLLGIMAFYTTDYGQLERLWGMSALGQRQKFRREDYRRRTIEYVLSKATESYTEPDDAELSLSRPPYIGMGQGQSQEQVRITSKTFAEIEDPGPQEYVWGVVIPKNKPAIIYGAAGTIKSIQAMSYGQAVADPRCHLWLGKPIPTCNVMYADWELGPADQHRRAFQIARGAGRDKPPDGFRYMSTNGIPRKQRARFFYDVLEECIERSVEICIIDSLGVAIEGDPSDRQTVMDLFEEVVPCFEAAGVTLWMIDHQRRLQPGEKTQSLGVYGSVIKEYLARAQIQVEFISRDREAHTVTTRLRPKKAQFGELPEPVEVKTSFSEECITLEVVELDDSDRATEETLSNHDRIEAALKSLGEAGPHELQETCGGVPLKSIKNTLSKMRNADPPKVFDTGEYEASGAAKVSLSQHYKGGRDRDTSPTKPTCKHGATIGLRCSLCEKEQDNERSS